MRKLPWLLLFYFSNVYGHSVLTSPTPRSNNAGLKTAPCGDVSRSSTPKVVQGGQTLTINWQEAINHPGRFYISLSMANDTNFSANKLATVIDNQNSGNTPHNFSTTVQIPNVNCDTCTIQLIQSMEENPNAPTFYYSCADIKIVASSKSTPAPEPVAPFDQTNKAIDYKGPAMSSCARVETTTPYSKSDIGTLFLLLLIPIAIALFFSIRSSQNDTMV